MEISAKNPIAIPAKQLDKVLLKRLTVSIGVPGGPTTLNVVFVPFQAANGELHEELSNVVSIEDALNDNSVKDALSAFLSAISSALG